MRTRHSRLTHPTFSSLDSRSVPSHVDRHAQSLSHRASTRLNLPRPSLRSPPQYPSDCCDLHWTPGWSEDPWQRDTAPRNCAREDRTTSAAVAHMDQHSPLINRDTPSAEDGRDVFADEFEVDDFDMVADGFRPQRDEHDDVQESVRSRTASAHYTHTPHISSHAPPGLQSRDSTRKSMTRDNPFVSPEDEEREPTLSFEPTHDTRRSVSSASSRMFARTSSPRLTSGPSHPYSMYPQGTLARTASVATTSTIRAPLRQSSDFPEGPQHPYSMYPQGVEEDDDDDEEHMPPTVGFPGRSRGYRRQLGPDGEEQDIIGEDGHTEQLPPYSRFPEDGPEKMPLLGAPAAPTPLRSRAPVAGSDPGMPLMHQSLLPTTSAPPQSMSDESALVRQETRQSTSPSVIAGNSLASDLSWSEKSWKERRKTRFWGIPVWCYVLAACVVGFIAAVLGGVVGGFVMGAHKHHIQ